MTTLIPGGLLILGVVLAAIATLSRHLVVVPPRRSRVVAIGCPVCRRLVKPRRFVAVANSCRDCAPPPGPRWSTVTTVLDWRQHPTDPPHPYLHCGHPALMRDATPQKGTS